MRQIVRVGIVLIAVAPVFGLVPGFAATTNEVRCAQLKQAEIGKNANCRLKALSVGTKRQAAPDYAKCDRKLAQKFSRLDQTVCAGNPPSATSVEGFLETITEVVSNAAGIDGGGTPTWSEMPPLGTTFFDECGRECSGSPGGPYDCVRIRKEVSDLTTNELVRFNAAFLAAYDAGSGGSELRERIEDFHVNFSALHNNGDFLPWHRGFILEVENLLREQDCRVTVPYWNWAKDTDVARWIHWGDSAREFSGNGTSGTDCVESGPYGEESGFLLTNGVCLKRSFSIGVAAPESWIKTNLFDKYPNASQYQSFRNTLEHGPGLHDSVHCIVGGTMCSARSANDPVFLFHHGQVDRLWSEWQDQSREHKEAYSGNTPVNTVMPASPWTPGEVLDLSDQPGGVSVRYQ